MFEPLSRARGSAPRAWQVINLLWVAWFAAFAILNLYVARNFTVGLWIKFKVFGFPAATMLFMIPQVLWLSSKLPLPAADRTQRLRERLERRFTPVQLTVEDESHLHAGHAGAASGQGHFRIRFVAEAFRGVSAVARHRLVYAAVDDLMTPLASGHPAMTLPVQSDAATQHPQNIQKNW